MAYLKIMKQVFQSVLAGSSYRNGVHYRTVKRLRKNKYTAIMMVALLIIPSIILNGVYAITVETDKDDFEPGETVVISGTANATSEILLSVLFNETHARDIIHDDDFTSFEDGNYSAIFVLDNDAEPGVYNVTVTSGPESDFVLFTVKEIESDNETTPDPEELGNVTASEFLSEGEGLGDAISRARTYLGRLKDMIGALRTEYDDNDDVLGNITVIEEKVGLAEGYLYDAESAVGDSHKEAVRYYAAARNLMGRIKGLLNSVCKTHKTARIEKFSAEVEKRIGGLESKINQLNDRLAHSQEVLSAMNSTKLKLNHVMKSLKAGNISTAMGYLNAIVDEIDGNIDNLNGTETAAQFKNMYKLEAKIRVLEKQALKMQRKGLNATEVLEDISLAQSQLGQVTSNVERGNKNKEGSNGVGMGNFGGAGSSGPEDSVKGYLKPKKNGKVRPSQSGPKKND
jgi:hypothetical protein